MSFFKGKNKKLLDAAKAGDETKVLKLLDDGAGVNAKDEYGVTPLRAASSWGHVAVVEALLARGGDVHAKDKYGVTPLHAASRCGHVAAVEALIARGADVNAKEEDGDTPLHNASYDGHVAVAEALLARGGDANAKNKDGSTPLHVASRQGHAAVVEVLLARGGDVHAKNKYERTPRDVAESRGHTDVVGVLDAARISPNLVNNVDVAATDTDAHAAIFYEKIMALHQGGEGDAGKRLGEIAALVEDPHMLKLFYMVVSSLRRAGILSQKEASNHIRSSLERSTKLCVCGYSIALYKLILNKAGEDGHLSELDRLRFDNDAEVHRMERAPFIKDIVASVQANTARIEGLEANVESINNSLDKIRRGIKRKMKVEGVVGLFSATLNVISFGAAGGLLSAGTAAFFEGVVDFGDVVHLKAVAADVEARFPDEDLVEQVDNGLELAAGTYADSLLMQAVQEGNVLVVVSANAAAMNEPALALSASATNDPALALSDREPPTGDDQVAKLKKWLSTFFQDKDVTKYCDCLVKEGFDSLEAVCGVMEEELKFMKKGHQRLMMKKLSELKRDLGLI